MKVDNVKLADVSEFIRGITFKPDDVVDLSTPNAIGCMRTKNVQYDLDENDVWGIDKAFVRNKSQMLKHGDLLISSANSWNLVGKACWIPDLPYESTFGGFVTVLRANPSAMHPRYLYYWFTADRTQQLLRSFGQQTTNISNLNLSRCSNMMIRLPSIFEQERIVEQLDRIDKMRIKHEKAIKLLHLTSSELRSQHFFD